MKTTIKLVITLVVLGVSVGVTADVLSTTNAEGTIASHPDYRTKASSSLLMGVTEDSSLVNEVVDDGVTAEYIPNKPTDGNLEPSGFGEGVDKISEPEAKIK